MAKKLYTKNNICELLNNVSNRLEIGNDVILTPSALDVIKERDITVVHTNSYSAKYTDSCESNSNLCKNVSSNRDQLIKSLVEILVNKYSIKDETVIKKVVLEILDKINK